MKILAVDDSPTTLRFLHAILNKLGYEDITEALSPIIGLEMVKNSSFDLILLDWNMPDMDGIEMLRVLKADKQTCTIPVLMVSSEKETENVVTAIDAGAEGYIVKPVNPELLRVRLQDIEQARTLGLKKNDEEKD